MKFLPTRALIVIGAALALGIGGAVAYGAIPSADGTFTACINKTSGSVRIIDAGVASAKCSSNELRRTWNQQGVPGADGVSGYEVVTDTIDFTAQQGGVFTGTQPTVPCPEGKVAIGGDAFGTITDNEQLDLSVRADRRTADHVERHQQVEVRLRPDDHLQTYRAGDHIEITLYATCIAVND